MQYIIVIAVIIWCLYKSLGTSSTNYVPKSKSDVQVPSVPKPVQKEVVVPVVKYKPEFGDWLWVHNNPGVNLAMCPVRKVPEWFIDKWVKTLSISPAERIIMDELDHYDIEWYREVSFVDMGKTEKGANYRFDFYFPTAYVVVEYDSKMYHSSPDRIAIDNIKDEFCKSQGIRIIRYSSEHYYHMAYHIEELMEELGVSRLSKAS